MHGADARERVLPAARCAARSHGRQSDQIKEHATRKAHGHIMKGSCSIGASPEHRLKRSGYRRGERAGDFAMVSLAKIISNLT